MRLQSLKHLIEVIVAVARPESIRIIGSSSLLPGHPELGESNCPLEVTTDADFLLEPINEGIAESLQLAVGEDSAFMAKFGYYADILRPTMGETLPAGWESRLHPMVGYTNVFTLDVYDLALVKLMVGREKDLNLLRALFQMGLIQPARLREHYQQCPLGEKEAMTAGRNLTLLLRELSSE
jgi:hypothetical protein